MKRSVIVLIIASIFLFLNDSSAMAEQKSQTDDSSIVKQALNQSTRVNVLFKGKVDYGLLEHYGATIIHPFRQIAAVTVEMPPERIGRLSQEAAVKSVSGDQLVRAQAQEAGWGHASINLAKRYPSTLSGKGVRIAIIDSGIDYKHPDLKIAGGKCVLDAVINEEACARSYYDEDGHGTHVAGIIGAQDNDIGVLGVAPCASIYGIKALDEKGNGTTSSVMAALEWAIQNKMDIINLSLTYTHDEPPIKELIQKAYKEGILIVAAAGNLRNSTGNENNVQYPGRYREVIAVSSLAPNHILLPTSSVGRDIELTAPGGSIYSTKPISQKSYGTMSGTSMAAPFVTGMAALYMEKHPELDHEEIRELLQVQAKDLGMPGKDNKFGYGLVQADAAMDDTKVAIAEQSNGAMKLDIALPVNATGYNLYRYGKRIITNGTSGTVEDYGVQGKIRYKLIPVIRGKEDPSRMKIFQANLSSPVLKDMKNGDWFNRHMMYLHHEKIMNGYASGHMKPNQNITRAEAVVLLVKALGLSPDERAAAFKDVTAASFGAGQIGAAVKNGILSGYPDGTFRGGQMVTRAEMSIMIAKGFKLASVSPGTKFTDIRPNMTGYAEINGLAAGKITEGYLDGTFRPYEKMSRATYAVFLAKAKNEKLK